MENDRNNNENFVKSELRKDTGFIAPKNYFKDVEDNFSVFLLKDKFPKENSFTTPKDYFEELEQSIVNRITIKKEVKTLSLKMHLLKYIPYATAASVALFLSLNYFISSAAKDASFDTLVQSDIEHWVVENSSELSDQDFATLIYSNLTNENDFALTDIKNDAIEEYIINSEDSSILNEIY
jgi:uncharacterized protein (DUF924 family)